LDLTGPLVAPVPALARLRDRQETADTERVRAPPRGSRLPVRPRV